MIIATDPWIQRLRDVATLAPEASVCLVDAAGLVLDQFGPVGAASGEPSRSTSAVVCAR